MTHAAKLAREDALTDAIRATDAAIGNEPPTQQALRILAALKRLRDSQRARVATLDRVDYLGRVQAAARAAWAADGGVDKHSASAGLDTPLGRLRAVVWRRTWQGEKRGKREVWGGEYYLNDEPITLAEIRAAGLAQRPTTRQRKKRLTVV